MRMKLFKNFFSWSGILFFGLALLLFANCKKGRSELQSVYFTGKEDYFVNDTLTFDTVFTSLGSTTRWFKIINTQNAPLEIDEIKLMQLQGNQFVINVDGVNGTVFRNVEIGAKDSIYVFVQVTVNPNNATNPLVLTDEVLVTDNGQSKAVFLQAWGQDAYYHLSETISGNVTWQNDKPHVIVHKPNNIVGLYVPVGKSLTIQPRTHIYVGANALVSIDGTLSCNGAAGGDSISFQGLRLESSFRNKPGQWFGLLYSRGANVTMNYTTINESYFGLSDEYVINVLVNDTVTTSHLATYSSNIPNITLNQTIIRNAASTAMTALYTNLNATNCLFHSCGGQMVVLAYGGNYDLKHCTIANVYNNYTSHKNASLILSEGIADIFNVYYKANTTATIQNTIVYGTLQNEIARVSDGQLTSSFVNCLLKTPKDTFNVFQPSDNGCIFNQDPKFINALQQNYTPDSLRSPAVNAGINLGVPIDLFGHSRDAQPDIGAIEWQ